MEYCNRDNTIIRCPPQQFTVLMSEVEELVVLSFIHLSKKRDKNRNSKSGNTNTGASYT